MMLVWTASNGLYSHSGTCLSAAAWTIDIDAACRAQQPLAVAHVADEEPEPVVVAVIGPASRTA